MLSMSRRLVSISRKSATCRIPCSLVGVVGMPRVGWSVAFLTRGTFGVVLVPIVPLRETLAAWACSAVGRTIGAVVEAFSASRIASSTRTRRTLPSSETISTSVMPVRETVPSSWPCLSRTTSPSAKASPCGRGFPSRVAMTSPFLKRSSDTVPRLSFGVLTSTFLNVVPATVPCPIAAL